MKWGLNLEGFDRVNPLPDPLPDPFSNPFWGRHPRGGVQGLKGGTLDWSIPLLGAAVGREVGQERRRRRLRRRLRERTLRDDGFPGFREVEEAERPLQPWLGLACGQGGQRGY